MHTREAFKELLQKDDWAVHRAIARIYERQTADEKAERTTRHSNGRGFASNDARLGTYYGDWVKSGRRLTGAHLVRARQMALKYVGQLVEVANERAAAKPRAVALTEAAMQAMEAEADREETLRDEARKHAAKSALEGVVWG